MIPHSLIRRTLLQVAIAMGGVILVATWITYVLMFDSLEARGLAQMHAYTVERAKREEAGFIAAEDNHRILRQVLLERLAAPPSGSEDAVRARFWQLVERTEDGAIRSRKELGRGSRHTTTWIHRDTTVDVELMRRILLLHDLCEQFFPAWGTRVQSLYVSGPERFNTGFDPLFPDWVWEIAADWDQASEAWARLGTVEANPQRVSAWTGITLDPTTEVPIVTLSTPVDFEGRHVATLHHDISLGNLLIEHLRPDHPSMMHLIFREDGLLIAHPEKMAELIAHEGRLSIAQSGDVGLQAIYRRVTDSPTPETSGYDPLSGNYFAVSRLGGPNWYFVTVMPRESVQRDAFGSAQWVLWTGLASLVCVIVLHGIVLRRQIARPLRRLLDAVERLARGEPARAALDRTDELGQLGRAFDRMVGEVASRDAELRRINVDLERRVTDRTSELLATNEQLDRARSEALELLSRERELGELKSGFVSLVSHEVRTPLGVIQSAADVMDRYFDRLSPAQRRERLDMIFRSVRSLTDLVDDVLMLGRMEDGRLRLDARPLDLPRLCDQVVDEVGSATGRRDEISLRCAPDLDGARGDPELLRHIVSNLLGNALKYSDPPADVEFLVQRRGADAVFTVRDHGIGIPSSDLAGLFQSFTRGSNVGTRPGTGLGLAIVQRCVDVHGGELSVHSELGEGTTVTVVVPMFPQSPPLPTLESTPA